MKPIKILIASIVVVLAIATIGASIVVAQTPVTFRRFFPDRLIGQNKNTGMMGGTTHSDMMNGQNHSDMMNGQSHSQMMGGTGSSSEDYPDMDQMHSWMMGSGGMHEIVWKAVAETLGLTPDELTQEISDGKSITQLAEEKGISKDQLAAALESTMKAGLAKAVEDKVITQEQADQMLEHMDGNYIDMLDHMSSMNQDGNGGCHSNNNTVENNTQS